MITWRRSTRSPSAPAHAQWCQTHMCSDICDGKPQPCPLTLVFRVSYFTHHAPRFTFHVSPPPSPRRPPSPPTAPRPPSRPHRFSMLSAKGMGEWRPVTRTTVPAGIEACSIIPCPLASAHRERHASHTTPARSCAPSGRWSPASSGGLLHARLPRCAVPAPVTWRSMGTDHHPEPPTSPSVLHCVDLTLARGRP